MTSPRRNDISTVLPTLDLRLRAWERTVYGIVCIGTWWLGERAGRTSSPCLVLLNPHRPIAAGRTVPVVIHVDDAWKWAPNTGDGAWASREIRGWLHAGLLPGNPSSVRDRINVMSAIEDGLRDLIAMPPLPPRNGGLLLGDLAIIKEDTGEVLGEQEIRA